MWGYKPPRRATTDGYFASIQNARDSTISAYRAAIDAAGATELDLKSFLESNPIFIPTPKLLNHGLHFNAIISQFNFARGYVADFAYLTKSTGVWWLVLIEFESPNVTLFLKHGPDPQRSAAFNKGINQVDDWRRVTKENQQAVRETLRDILVPLAWNPISIFYILVIGRSQELLQDERKRISFGGLNTGDLTILTYDSLLSGFENSQWANKNVFSLQKDGVHVKRMTAMRTPMVYLGPDKLRLTPEQLHELRARGYAVDSWLKGNALDFQIHTPQSVDPWL